MSRNRAPLRHRHRGRRCAGRGRGTRQLASQAAAHPDAARAPSRSRLQRRCPAAARMQSAWAAAIRCTDATDGQWICPMMAEHPAPAVASAYDLQRRRLASVSRFGPGRDAPRRSGLWAGVASWSWLSCLGPCQASPFGTGIGFRRIRRGHRPPRGYCVRSARAALTAALACSAPSTLTEAMAARASSGDTSWAMLARPSTLMCSVSPRRRAASRSPRL